MTIKTKLTVFSLLVAVLATSFVTVFADSGEVKEEVLPPKFEHREMLKEALGNGDYDAVAEMHQERTGEVLAEETFNKMMEAHRYMKEGDKESAKEIMDELGIKPPKMHKFKEMKEKFQNKNCKCECGAEDTE